MKESTKKRLWALKEDLVNVLSFGSGGYDPVTGKRGPYRSNREMEEEHERRKRWRDLPR